ncbi:MAG: WYL domain-containing protein [Flavobacteriales bacterium]|nr:WYL domain-containing protein [Flavobacteriales bacterium]
MPSIKNAQIRYRIIDRALRSEYDLYPKKEDLRELCEDNLFGSVSGEHISDSTIEKDLYTMRMEHDAPIKYSKKEKGYYYDDPDYSLENIPLSEDDIIAIKFAANIFEQFKGIEVFRQFEFAIEKILDRVYISNNIEDSAVDQFVQFETTSKTLGGEFLQPLLSAIKEKLIVTFEYKSFKAKTEEWKSRKVHPYLLKEYRNRWYLIGFSEEKGKVITYGLDRMKALKPTDEYFLPEGSFNSDNYFKHTIGITTSDGKVPEKIELKANTVLMKYLNSQPLHSSQKLISETDNGGVYTFEIHPTPEFDMAILSYGSQAKVLKPLSYDQHISTIAKNMYKLYH